VRRSWCSGDDAARSITRIDLRRGLLEAASELARLWLDVVRLLGLELLLDEVEEPGPATLSEEQGHTPPDQVHHEVVRWRLRELDRLADRLALVMAAPPRAGARDNRPGPRAIAATPAHFFY